MLDEPCELIELIELTPAMVANCFSSGRATAEAIVSGLAPGKARLHLNRREIDRGKIADREEPVRHRAEHEHADDEQRGRNRPFDEKGREIHVRPLYPTRGRVLRSRVFPSGEVAQLVEHTTENRSVDSSILSLATI